MRQWAKAVGQAWRCLYIFLFARTIWLFCRILSCVPLKKPADGNLLRCGENSAIMLPPIRRDPKARPPSCLCLKRATPYTVATTTMWFGLTNSQHALLCVSCCYGDAMIPCSSFYSPGSRGHTDLACEQISATYDMYSLPCTPADSKVL